MIKAAGIVFVILSSSGLGFLYSFSVKKRIAVLEAMQRFIGDVSEEIRLSRDTTYAILYRLLSHGYSELSFLKPAIKHRKTYLQDLMFMCSAESTALNEKDKKLFAEFFSKLGRTDLRGQISHCEEFRARIRNTLHEEKDATIKKAVMIRSLGALCGVFIAIFLI
ncbi:MAG: stage III sporulation protein AB [Bacillota bacterium]|nr:stage III sporulation protein AB [Bacillota bacterium]